MAIYRGPGGSGDATTDASSEATIASNKAAEAATSATAAAASASSASTSATTATTQATSATTSATNAATSASNASTSATNAATSASSAATSATAALSSQEDAETAETNASASATSAASSATSASTSATTATTQAGLASTSATNAAISETNAGTSATTATTKASEAATSASNASTSETNAASSASTASSAATTATTQASNASTSATNASTSATNAASSASAAATSATNAATSETNAANSASAASTSETNAATSETNAAASYDAFDDRYLGAKSSAPTVDNDGDALLTGALYWNTTNDQLYVWTGSAWDEAAFSVTGAVTSFNTRTGAVTLASGDVTSALGFTPQDAASAVSAINDLSDVVITTPSTNQILKYNGTNWVNGSDTDTGILYTDLSVTTAAAGSPALSYNNTNGVFTYTPPDLTSYITASSTDTFTNKSGNISQWTNDSGYLTSETYTGTVTSVAATVPVGFTIAGSPVTSSGTLAISFDTGYSLPTTASQTNWNTAYGWGNHASAGYLTSFTETNDLTAAVTWANVPNANITQTSVTQHQAALSITESQISDLGTYVTKTSSTGSGVLPAGTEAQRDVTPAAGYLRFNTTSTSFEGYDGSAWGAIGGSGGGGASAGGAIYENTDEITSSYTIAAGKNGHSVGPITIASGVAVTITSGQRWVVA
jgi:hypothetical protein